MQAVYHEAFPDRYLIMLVPSNALKEAELAAQLDRACRSSKIAVWVDCRLLKTLSVTATWLLRACQQRLRRRQVHLVMCSTSVDVEQALRQMFSPADLCLVPTLDAAVNHLDVGCEPGPS